jgi:ABC-2 type transport system ATP-binding protein
LLIECDNLHAGYGRKTVLHDVTLRFDGGAAGLLGPNGAGKSTLLKTLLGFLPPISGKARVFGLPVPARAQGVRARIGYMPETESFIPGVNAVAFVAAMGELSGLPRPAAMERAHEVLQYVGLGESRYRNVETYSTGMKQRAKLAQAIVHDPALVLLDEPTNGMDPAGRVEMLELVDDLARHKQISVILCSHLLKDVESVANEIIVLGNGRVLYKKMAERIGGGGETVYSVRVRGDRAAFVRALQQEGWPLADDEAGARTLVTLPHGTEPAVIHRAAAAAGCVVQRLEPRVERLEDLFTEAIGELGNAHL